MLKKILLGALVAVSTFGMFSTSEARCRNYDCGENYRAGDHCCENYYSRNDSKNYYGNCYEDSGCYGEHGCY